MLELMPTENLKITREVFESSVQMAEDALRSINVDPSVAEQAVTEFRRRDLARLKAQFKTGNMRAGSRHSFGGKESDDFAMDEG